jgi:hypothetical protein
MANRYKLIAQVVAGLGLAIAFAANAAAQPAGTAPAPCSTASPRYAYVLDPAVGDLFPVIRTASMSAYDNATAVAASIQFYLHNSIARDQLNACYLQVEPDSASGGYKVEFHSADPRAAAYGATHAAWLKNGRLGLQGVQNCQKDATCWEPKGPKLACVGPWQFYLPLGLPMIAQKMVMLLHYPPYTALQQSDYLNNATLNRWQRLLAAAGVPGTDLALYTTTVDIFPIAAPGSGQAGCFAPASAGAYFGARGAGYIPAMLGALALAPPAGGGNTIPIVIYGKEAIGYWNATYPDAPTDVNKAGSVKLGAAAAGPTPFMGANHPIAAVYQDCRSEPGIEAMVKQDLTTACFARSMSLTPGADPLGVAGACRAAYHATAPAADIASQICVTAVVDKSPQFAPWTTVQARQWCDAHKNAPCPLPDY